MTAKNASSSRGACAWLLTSDEACCFLSLSFVGGACFSDLPFMAWRFCLQTFILSRPCCLVVQHSIQLCFGVLCGRLQRHEVDAAHDCDRTCTRSHSQTAPDQSPDPMTLQDSIHRLACISARHNHFGMYSEIH